MCLAIPGKVIEIITDALDPQAKIDFGGVVKKISIIMTPEVTVGEYVLVHVGFAISIMNKHDALQTLQDLQYMGE